MTKLTIPSGSAELEEMLADGTKMKNLMQEGQFPEFIKAYASATNKTNLDIQAQVQEQVQLGLAEFLKDNGADVKRVPFTMNGLQNGGWKAENFAAHQYNALAPGAKADDIFSSAGEFLQATHYDLRKFPNKAELEAKLQKLQDIKDSYSSQVPADGGFLIPEVMRSALMSVALESSVVRPRAQVIPMSNLRVPIPAIDSTSNVSSVFGGVVCYWTEEGAALTESQAAFQRIVLEAKKLTGYAEMPNELVSDTIASNAYFSQTFPRALAWYEDLAFMKGTGVGEPLGAFNAGNTASVAVAAESGQAADTIVWENVVKMYARMLPGSLGSAVWVVSPDTFPELATMALSVGTGGSAIWLQDGKGTPQLSILGRPVIVSEKAAKIGDLGDINFVDFSYYLVGDRQVMQADSSPHYKFKNDVTAFRIISRVDGRPWLQSAITPQNNGATLSPFVQLAAR